MSATTVTRRFDRLTTFILVLAGATVALGVSLALHAPMPALGQVAVEDEVVRLGQAALACPNVAAAVLEALDDEEEREHGAQRERRAAGRGLVR